MSHSTAISVLYLGPDPRVTPKLHDFIADRDRVIARIQARAAEFRAFLNEHFATVKVVTPDEYNEAMSDDFDVTIFDAFPNPIGERHQMGAKLPVLISAGFTRPALCIGNVTWRLIGRVGLNRKLDHL